MSILWLFHIIAWFKIDVESYDLKVLKTMSRGVKLVFFVAVVALVTFVANVAGLCFLECNRTNYSEYHKVE